MSKTYIVAYTLCNLETGAYTDYYTSFRDEDFKDNAEAAEVYYNDLLAKENLYTASITKVIKSTDY